MVARNFLIRHGDSIFDVEYNTEDGLEVFKLQLFSLTSILPDDQKILAENGDRPLSGDSDLLSISEKLRLVSITEESEERQEPSGSEKSNAELLKSDEELARMLQAEEEELFLRQYVGGENGERVEKKIRPYISRVRMYEDPVHQEAARKTVPIERLEEKALVSLAKEGNLKPSKIEQDHAFLLQLLFWFKQSFRWVNRPPCDGCGEITVSEGMGNALESELRYGATRVELYRCNLCSRITRFPRYNDPMKLLETRKGRCGEWANCFTLYCRAFGYESRLVLDFTDHVWTECFSEYLGRWMHLDPCEQLYDRPLLYEKGWNKKLNYIIAIANDGVYDVTKRYTRKWHEVLSRRILIAESVLLATLANFTKECRSSFAPQVLSKLEDRDKTEQDAIERDILSPDDPSVSLPGRQSGNKEWRISRAEFGCDSFSSSSCPVRMCIDEHVTGIYNAFSPVLSHFINFFLPKSKVIEVLEIFRGLLVDLKKKPYKTRSASLRVVPSERQSLVNKFIPSVGELLDVLSLTSKFDIDGRIDICLAGDPIKTAFTLPVALHALDVLIHNLSKCQNFGKDSLTFPLLKLNRICSGSVLASGEELPSGIATSAFDGTRLSKWEEPNGGKGCWIIYKSFNNQMHELVAYEFMSANDAAERDPMDWIVEGSNDGGSNWHVLDKQTNQLFENRYEQRSYRITSTGFPSNLFRFQFLAVRDVQSTSRLQIGSIDLYAKSS